MGSSEIHKIRSNTMKQWKPTRIAWRFHVAARQLMSQNLKLG